MSSTGVRERRTEIVGACPKGYCGGDLAPVVADGTWGADVCMRCNGTWCHTPREERLVVYYAVTEARRRELHAMPDAKLRGFVTFRAAAMDHDSLVRLAQTADVLPGRPLDAGTRAAAQRAAEAS